MALQPPDPNIEHPPVGKISERHLREQSRRLQRFQDFVAQLFPLGPQHLGKGAKELFPQLATAHARKINFGVAEIEWAGGTPISKELEVSHELGTTPLAVVANDESLTIIGTKGYTSTKFKVWGRTGDGSSPAEKTKEKVHWIAIG